MHETQRLIEAANALGTLLRNSGIPHAFYGSMFTAMLSNNPISDVSALYDSKLFLAEPEVGDFMYC